MVFWLEGCGEKIDFAKQNVYTPPPTLQNQSAKVMPTLNYWKRFHKKYFLKSIDNYFLWWYNIYVISW